MNKIISTATIVKAQDASEITVNDLNNQVQQLALSDARFNNKPSAQTNGNSVCSSIWVCDILTDGAAWKAVLSAMDGKTYEVGFTVESGKVTKLGDDATPVTRKTMYVSAKEVRFNGELVKAAGTSDGAGKGHAARKTALADKASQAAHEASAKAHETGEDADHEAAQVSHEIASEAHKKAMLAHAKAGDGEKAGYHATAMAAHDACADAHGGEDEEKVEASLKSLSNIVKAKATQKKDAAPVIQATSHDIVHCRASGSKLRSDAAPEWKQDVPVEFCYMPGGLHTINAGFCGPITKGRAASINLTLDVDPDRDAAVCQASAEALKAESPKQDIYGCYEHDEKKASVWARDVDKGIFKSGVDPVHQEPCILLAAVPSGDGAADVNKKNWRSWSPSFSTNAEYTKCKCSRCETGISVCACDKPQFYFPPNARGSAEKPAQITGIDSVLGTLTNKPAFRAMPPVRARQQDGTVKGADDLDTSKESESYQSKAKRAELKSKVAKETEKTYPEGENHGEKLNAHCNAEWAHQDAAAAATTAAVKQHHMDAAKEHNEAAQEHQKVVAKQQATEGIDTILARVKPVASVDTILAKYKQVGVRVIGYAAELAQADEILERINKK